MITMLAKIFIKNRPAKEQRQAYGTLCSIVGICLNVCLFTSSGISAGSSCTGRAASVSSFFFSSISILRTSYHIPAVGTGQNKKRRQRPASTPCQGFHAHKAAPFLPAEKCPNSTSYRAKKANAACSMSRPIAPKPHLRL